MGLEPTTSGLEVQCAIQLRHASNYCSLPLLLFHNSLCNPIKHIISVSRRIAGWMTVSSRLAWKSSFPWERARLSSILYRRLPFPPLPVLPHFRQDVALSPFPQPIGYRILVFLYTSTHSHCTRFLSFSIFMLLVSRYPSCDPLNPTITILGELCFDATNRVIEERWKYHPVVTEPIPIDMVSVFSRNDVQCRHFETGRKSRFQGKQGISSPRPLFLPRTH